jgi:hypothetical protein
MKNEERSAEAFYQRSTNAAGPRGIKPSRRVLPLTCYPCIAEANLLYLFQNFPHPHQSS